MPAWGRTAARILLPRAVADSRTSGRVVLAAGLTVLLMPLVLMTIVVSVIGQQRAAAIRACEVAAGGAALDFAELEAVIERTAGRPVGVAISAADGTLVFEQGAEARIAGGAITAPLSALALARGHRDQDLAPADRRAAVDALRHGDLDAADRLVVAAGAHRIAAAASAAGMHSWTGEVSRGPYRLANAPVTAGDLARLFARLDTLTPARHRAFLRVQLGDVDGAGAAAALAAEGGAKLLAGVGKARAESGRFEVAEAVQVTFGEEVYAVAVALGEQRSAAAGAAAAATIARAAGVALADAGQADESGIKLPASVPYRGAGGTFEATSYGAPWNSMEGYGTTATGIPLPDAPTGRAGPFIIAVDPAVIPFHSRVRVWPNPFNHRGWFQAEDTGGSIVGQRIDFLDMRGRASQNSWGRRSVTITPGGPYRVADEALGTFVEDPAGVGADAEVALDCADVDAGAPAGPLQLTRGERARVLLNGLAAAPEKAPVVVKRMIAAGNTISDRAYVYGGGHGSSLDRISPNHYDCSSAVSFVLRNGSRALFGEYAMVSGDLERYGEPGPGKWVTIYANESHAFMYVAGVRFDTSRNGTDVGPNAAQDGPRWRVHPAIPSWATWVVRHPPGL